MNKEKFSNPKLKIQDSNIQFTQLFEVFGIDKIKEIIKNLKTLEDYTALSKEELEKVKPDICNKYNSLIKELQKEDLTIEKLKEIKKEVWNLTH